MQPSRLDVAARQALDKPSAAETTDVLKARRKLAAERVVTYRIRDGALDAHLLERAAKAGGVAVADGEQRADGVSGARVADRCGEIEIGGAHVLRRTRCGRRRRGFVAWTGLDLDHDLQRGV